MSLAEPSATAEPAPAGPPPALTPDASRSSGARWRALAEGYALPLLLVLFALFFSLWGKTSEVFLTSENLQSLVSNQSVVGIAALAALIPLICNQFDLSVGAVLGLSSILAASLLESGGSVPLAIAVGIGVGGLVGVVNGLLVTRARVVSVIATLGTAVCIRGIVTWKTEGASIVDIPASMTDFGSATAAGVPAAFLVLLVVAALVYYLLEQTPFGRYLHALGSNANAASLVGLDGRRLVFSSFVVSGLLAGGAGVLLLARIGSASPRVGENFTLPALAAAFLSAAAIRAGRFNAGGVVVAVFFVAVINTGLALAGAESWVNDVVNGTALIAGVALAGLFRRDRATRGFEM